jgi:hypothetical protein
VSDKQFVTAMGVPLAGTLFLELVDYYGLIAPFELIELNGDVPLAHTEKAANPNRHVGDLAVLVEHQLLLSPSFSKRSLSSKLFARFGPIAMQVEVFVLSQTDHFRRSIVIDHAQSPTCGMLAIDDGLSCRGSASALA